MKQVQPRFFPLERKISRKCNLAYPALHKLCFLGCVARHNRLFFLVAHSTYIRYTYTSVVCAITGGSGCSNGDKVYTIVGKWNVEHPLLSLFGRILDSFGPFETFRRGPLGRVVTFSRVSERSSLTPKKTLSPNFWTPCFPAEVSNFWHLFACFRTADGNPIFFLHPKNRAANSQLKKYP